MAYPARTVPHPDGIGDQLTRQTQDPGSSALLTDLYQLTMLHSYVHHGMTAPATFEFFSRKLPPTRNFLMAAGLEQAIEFLEAVRFTEEELDWVARSPLIASKAARSLLAAPGKLLVDFGLWRAHGAEAGLLAARAGYLAGMSGSATVLAELRFGVPAFGTMAHSFVQAHDDETQAFLDFARDHPRDAVLLLDTSADAPYLDCAYKIQEYAGRLRRKRSEGKATWPGRKQVYRRIEGAWRLPCRSPSRGRMPPPSSRRCRRPSGASTPPRPTGCEWPRLASPPRAVDERMV